MSDPEENKTNDIVVDMTSHMRGTVVINGVPVKGVRSVKFTAGNDEANVLTLEIFADKMLIKGPAHVRTTAIEEPNRPIDAPKY